jgi:polar amino acid transport system substrate-binding protein
VGGVEAQLVLSLARELGARVEWVRAPEARLLESLHDRGVDLVLAGLTADTPWAKKVALTRPYYTDTAAFGAVPGAARPEPREERHVLAAPPGENAWLVRVERALHAREREVPAMLRAAAR